MRRCALLTSTSPNVIVGDVNDPCTMTPCDEISRDAFRDVCAPTVTLSSEIVRPNPCSGWTDRRKDADAKLTDRLGRDRDLPVIDVKSAASVCVEKSCIVAFRSKESGALGAYEPAKVAWDSP